MGYSPWGCKDLDASEHTHITKFVYYIYTYIYIHTYILFQILFLYRLLQNTE